MEIIMRLGINYGNYNRLRPGPHYGNYKTTIVNYGNSNTVILNSTVHLNTVHFEHPSPGTARRTKNPARKSRAKIKKVL